MKTVDITPTWIDVLNMARQLAIGNPALQGVLKELETPCKFTDEKIKENKHGLPGN